MTEKEISAVISAAEYDIIGIRADDRIFKVGDELPPSHQLFQDPVYSDPEETELAYPYVKEGPYAGFYDAGELPGTCALRVHEGNIPEVLERVNCYGRHGNKYLIAGNKYEYGNDLDEVVITDAVVIAVL